MEDLYQLFGHAVRKHRRAKKLSQDDLAVLTKMGRPTIASIEKGRQAVALHQVFKLGQALDVEVATLISGLSAKSVPSELRELHASLNPHDFEILEQLHEELL